MEGWYNQAAPGSSRSLRDSTLSQMMISGAYSDMSFTCNGEVFRLHKAVVLGKSDVIRAATEGGFQEGQTSNIVLDGYQPAIVKRLVQFLYTSNYDDPDADFDFGALTGDNDTGEEQGAGAIDAPPPPATRAAPTKAELIVGHIRMNGIGDYFQIKELASLAKRKIDELVHHEAPDQTWVEHLSAISRAAAQLTADDAVLKTMSSCVAENLGLLLTLSSFKESDMMTEFALQILDRANHITQSLGEELAMTKQKLGWANKNLLDARVRIKKMDTAVGILQNTAKCRNTACKTDFNATINTAEFSLRCKVCHCRHSPAPATNAT